MKIVCDACSAKYSIADEKVKGKVFKIRCKKCSNIIVVRGNAGAAAEEPAPAPAGQFDQKETRVYDYGGYEGEGAPPSADDAVWHIVVDQEQVGPITAAEVGQRFAAGELDAESYIWREGFADWLPLSQVPEFTALAAGGSTTTAQPSSGEDAVASMFGAGAGYEDGGTSRSDPNDVFAAHAAKATAAAADDADDGADDLFGQGGARTAKGRAEPAAGAGKAAVSPSSLKGQRSENSVLFSLNNLAALASDSPKAAAAPVSSSSSSGAAQHGGGEGSGLIDIRSMASAYLGAAKSSDAAPGGRSVGSIDDLPVFSTTAFSEPAVIIPSVGAGRGNNKLMYGLLGAVALLAIVLVVVVVVLVTGGDDKPSTAGQVAVGSGGGTATQPDQPAGGTEPGTAAGPAGTGATGGGAPGGGTDPAAGGAAAGAGSGSAEEPGAGTTGGGASGTADSGDRKPGGSTASSDRKPGGSTASSDRKPGGSTTTSDRKPGGTTATSDKKPPADKPPADTGGKCLDEVACLLADRPPACCAKYRGSSGGGGGGGSTTKPPSGGGGSNLPESLQKADISAGIGGVRARVDGCAAKSSAKGTVKVSVKVDGSGAVSSVTVRETPDAGLGSCVAAAVQKATFKKTQTGGSFSYPFTFR